MNGIHYHSSTLKVSQLTFKVIVQKRTQQWWKKHFHFQELPYWMSEISHLELTGCCWEQSSITQGQLSGCGSYSSHFLSLLSKYTPVPAHITHWQPGWARVWAPHSQQHSMLACSQQRGSIAVLHHSIVAPSDVKLLLYSCDCKGWYSSVALIGKEHSLSFINSESAFRIKKNGFK